MSIHGIDVSEFQGNINWDSVKAAGVQFAMIRAGYGAGNADVQFRRNAEGCNRVGIPFGVYWFSYAYTPEMARQEARYCIEAIEEFKVLYPVCLDFEYDSVRYAQSAGVSVDSGLATALAEAFCRQVEELGYFAMYYSNLDFLNRFFAPGLRDKFALWYAQYARAPEISGMAIWQNSDAGAVGGVPGNVDTDIAYYDLAEVISRAGLNKLKESAVTPAPERGTVVTYTVRAGDTLSGIAARYGTTYQAIAAYNGIANPNLIYPGQRIRILLGGGGSYFHYYTIRSGDTLSGIALRFGTTVAELQRLNGISNPDLIYAGTTIRVR